MKFGRRLLQQAHAPWTSAYLPYEDLKRIINLLAEGNKATANKAEGEFLTALLGAIDVVDTFYTQKEAEYHTRLKALAETLAAPRKWLLQCPTGSELSEPDFPEVVAMLEGGVHVPSEQREALDAFLTLCNEVDVLRRFSVRSDSLFAIVPPLVPPPQTSINKCVSRHGRCSTRSR